MKRILTPILAVLAVAAAATTVLAADYDRYERGYPPSSPPPRAAYAPPVQHGVHGQGYFFGHLGLFDPNDSSSGLKGYDSGSSFDFGFGSRVLPVLAIEGTFGGYGADVGSNDVTVVPLTFGVRLIVPNPIIEPYVGGGKGLYLAHLEEPVNGIDDSDSTVGGYLSLGLDAWLNQRVALNFEGRYHFVEPQFEGNGGSFDVNVGGWTASMGVRISF